MMLAINSLNFFSPVNYLAKMKSVSHRSGSVKQKKKLPCTFVDCLSFFN